MAGMRRYESPWKLSRDLGEGDRSQEKEKRKELEASSEWGKEKIVAIFCLHLPALFLFYSSLVPIVL